MSNPVSAKGRGLRLSPLPYIEGEAMGDIKEYPVDITDDELRERILDEEEEELNKKIEEENEDV